MKFSVIVPVYKTEAYLPECMEHLLNQTFPDLEVILVDDGSPDGCPAMADRYAAQDPRVKVIHKPNGGLVSARKAGAAVAQGEYIVNVDSDDYIANDLLERLNAAMGDRQPDAVLYGLTFFGEGLRIPYDHKLPVGFYEKEQMEALRATFLYDPALPRINNGTVLFPICLKAIRQELYQRCQAQVPDQVVSGEDMLFTMHLLNQTETVLSTDINGYFYRQNFQSMEHSVTDRDFENLYLLSQELQKGMGDPARENQISVYLFSRVWALTVRGAKTKEGYSSFRARLRNPYLTKLFPMVKKTRICQKAKQDHIVLFLLKHCCFFLIYFLANSVLKNKDI